MPKQRKLIEGLIQGDVEMGESSSLKPGSLVSGQGGKVRLGEKVSINHGAFVGASPGSQVTIGDYTSIGPGARVTASHHRVHSKHYRRPHRKTEDGIVIGADCLIGANAVIQFGATIPDHVVIGALSLVTNSSELSSWGIYAGCPVKKIGDRRDKDKY